MSKRTRYRKEENPLYVRETWNERVTRTEKRAKDTCASCGKEIKWLPFGGGSGKCACSYWRLPDFGKEGPYTKTPYMDWYCRSINNGAVFKYDPYPEFWGEIEFKHNRAVCEWVMSRCKGAKEQVNTGVMML